MTNHILADQCLTALWWLSPVMAASGQIIVGKGYPFPRWFLSSSSPPPPTNQVVADGIDVVADGIAVVAS